MISKRVIAFAVLSAALLPGTSLAQVPLGACILPDNTWCIPPVRGLPGDICTCLTDDGGKTGTQN